VGCKYIREMYLYTIIFTVKSLLNSIFISTGEQQYNTYLTHEQTATKRWGWKLSPSLFSSRSPLWWLMQFIHIYIFACVQRACVCCKRKCFATGAGSEVGVHITFAIVFVTHIQINNDNKRARLTFTNRPADGQWPSRKSFIALFFSLPHPLSFYLYILLSEATACRNIDINNNNNNNRFECLIFINNNMMCHVCNIWNYSIYYYYADSVCIHITDWLCTANVTNDISVYWSTHRITG